LLLKTVDGSQCFNQHHWTACALYQKENLLAILLLVSENDWTTIANKIVSWGRGL